MAGVPVEADLMELLRGAPAEAREVHEHKHTPSQHTITNTQTHQLTQSQTHKHKHTARTYTDTQALRDRSDVMHAARINTLQPPRREDGSCVIVVATNAPLESRNLERLATVC